MNRLRRTIQWGWCVGLVLLLASPAFGGARLEIDETKWISVGAGARSSFTAQEGGAVNGRDWSKHFGLDNMRLYVNGQIHKYLQIEFNTDCTSCTNGGDIIVLDAIAKFEISPSFNIWAGRMLVPADRAELDGPYFQNTFEFNKTPFYPADFGNYVAGRFGRDDGVNVWGAFLDDRLTYVVGVFDGVDYDDDNPMRPNTSDHPLWAGRVSYNFWNVEQNPGYYTSSTYYGKAGDILTLALAAQYHEDGAGTAKDQSNFFGYSIDALMEKTLPGDGVLTVEGEYKAFDTGLNTAALMESKCFCLFDGHAWTMTGLYLFPEKLGEGQLQPYVRFTENVPELSSHRSEFEIGANYIIDGHNARVSLFYQYGDIATKGRNWDDKQANRDEVSALKLAVQWQL